MAKKKLPEEFDLLSKECQKIFMGLKPKNQTFLIEFLVNGCTGSEAYRRSYDRKSISDTAASSGANYVTTSDKVSKVIEEYSRKNWADVVEAKRALKDALEAHKTVFSKTNEPMDLEDHPTRIKAAVEVLKSNGEYTERHEHSGDPDKPLIQTIERIIVKNDKAKD